MAVLSQRQIDELNHFIKKYEHIINDSSLYNLYLQDNICINMEDMIDRNILNIKEFKRELNKYKQS